VIVIVSLSGGTRSVEVTAMTDPAQRATRLARIALRLGLDHSLAAVIVRMFHGRWLRRWEAAWEAIEPQWNHRP